MHFRFGTLSMLLAIVSMQAGGQVFRDRGNAVDVNMRSGTDAGEVANPLIQEIIGAVSRDTLASTIRALQGFRTRYETTLQRDSAAEYILQTFKSFGIQAESDRYVMCQTDFNDVAPVSPDTLWAVGSNATIVVTTNAGSTWIRVTSPVGTVYSAVDFPTRFKGWAAGSSGAIIHTTDAGAHWRQQSSGVTVSLRDIDFADELLGIATTSGSGGVVLRTTDGGTNWVKADSGTVQYLNSLEVFDTLNVWAGSGSGNVLRSTDGGLHWMKQATGGTSSVTGIDFVTREIGWVVYGDRMIRRTTDGGQSWSLVQSPPGSSDYLVSVAFQDSAEGYVGNYAGDVFRTTDGGQNWKTILYSGYNTSLRSIKTASDGGILCCGGSGMLVSSQDYGATWTRHTRNIPALSLQWSRNIIATIAGRVSPENECIIVAHYDSNSPKQKTDAPGANDNASGTSAVVEAARIFRNYAFANTVRFIAVSAEELGLFGSADYAWRARNGGRLIVGVVNGDMIGYPITGDSTRLVLECYGARNRLIDTALAFNARYHMGLKPFPIWPSDAEATDHATFGSFGYDAVSVQEGSTDEIRMGFDPFYHQTTDIIDNLNLGLVRGGAQMMLAIVAGIAIPLERTTGVPGSAPIPEDYVLYQNYPNPFNPSTTIKYELPKSSQVKLTVYDMLGREVSVLVDERRDAGVHEVKFDGSNLASGVYFYRMQTGDFVQSRKSIFLK